jgi:hypothetical protein
MDISVCMYINVYPNVRLYITVYVRECKSIYKCI